VIDGLEGHIDANAVSGKMQLSNLSGNFDFSSVSGKITADHISGPLQLNNVSGKVHISESQIPSMIGKTVSGHVTIETPLTEGPYDFKSVSGNLSVITPEDTACTIRIKSVSGSAKVNLPVTGKSGARNKQVVEVAGGGPEVNVKSVSGVLKIGSSKEGITETELIQTEVEFDKPIREVSAPNDEAQSEIPEPQTKSQMEILQEIESGEISVEEALKQLNP